MWTLYDRLRMLCEERGIKGAKMCTDLGISKSLMTDLKSGRKKTISAPTAQKIATYFGVSVGYLLGEETKNAPTRKDERDVVDEVDIAFYDEYKELDDEQNATIRDMVAVMRSRKGKRS